jgi:hypothetical protein
MRLVKILIRKGIEIDLVELTQVDHTFVGLGVRCGLIGRFRQRFFSQEGFEIWYASCNKMQGWRIMWNEVQHDMNEQKDMT